MEKDEQVEERNASETPAKKKRGTPSRSLSTPSPKKIKPSPSLSAPPRSGRPPKRRPAANPQPSQTEADGTDKVSAEAMAEKPSRPHTELESERNDEIVAGNRAIGEADRPGFPNPVTRDRPRGREVRADGEAEKMKSLAITRVESTGQMEENGTSLISPTPINGISDDQDLPLHIEERRGGIERQNAQDFPFAKLSPVWQEIESMDVFKKFPQRPHFRSLERCSELEREGLAVAKTLHFVLLIERISELRENSSPESVRTSLENLAAFEELGFDVEAPRELLNERLRSMARLEELVAESKRIGFEMARSVDRKAEVDKCLLGIDEEIKALQEKRAVLMSKRAESETKLAELQVEVGLLKEDIASKLSFVPLAQLG